MDIFDTVAISQTNSRRQIDDLQTGMHGSIVNLTGIRTSTLNCVDLFAGAGGFSLAALRVGFNVIAAVEHDRHACQTYQNNIVEGNQKITLYSKDILELRPEELRNAHFSDDFRCDIVLGGPPCQGFSVHRIKDAGVGDPRNALILRYFEFVECLQPKVFLMENVPGLLWPRHRDFLHTFYRHGNLTGYNVLDHIVLDARNYSVPQRRKRVFILGIRKGIGFDETAWPPIQTHGDEKAISDNSSLKRWCTANSEKVFARAPKRDRNNNHMIHSVELTNVFKTTPVNGGTRHQSSRILPCHKDHKGHNDVYGRIDPREPGPTMTTACINPSKGRFVHPTQHHGITLRHAARFQTFPDGFVFEGGLMSAGAQIGNAVPIRLGEALLRAISKGLATEQHA